MLFKNSAICFDVKHKRLRLVFGVAFENQLIEFLYDSKSLGVIWSSE